MTAPHATQIVEGYLARLEVALKDVPASRRQELVGDVRSHVAESRRALTDETDADLLGIIDRLGDPMEVAGEEGGRNGSHQPATTRWGWMELGAILLTIVIWPAGAILVWLSRVWNTPEKVIATVIGAVAFVIGFPLFGPLVGTVLPPLVSRIGSFAPVLIGTLGAFNLFSAVYLATRLMNRESSLPGAAG